MSCSSNPEEMIQNLPGYWEVTEVSKDGKLIKSYTMSSSIDYFELTDEFTGFRKKVNPTLNGTYIVSQHQIPFSITIEDAELILNYSDNGIVYKESVIEATDNNLRIKNEQGFVYTYETYKPISISE